MSENIIADIKKDHEELEYFYSKMKSSTNEDEEKSWFNQFIFEISRHSVGEEQVLYPLMETLGEKGKILAAESREDHDKLKRVLTEILKENNLTLFNSKIDAMMSDLREHIKNEEEKDLVFLSDKVSIDGLSKASKAFALKKKIAPTRPHPSIPQKPWALEAALGIMTAPFDKFADLFRDFPDKDDAKFQN